MKEILNIRTYLINKLKEASCFWSYDNNVIKDVPDSLLVELVMLHLDIAEINLLFVIFPFKRVKQLWLENVVAQGERYYTLNFFFAWYYFKAKHPRQYVKSMATRLMNKKMSYE